MDSATQKTKKQTKKQKEREDFQFAALALLGECKDIARQIFTDSAIPITPAVVFDTFDRVIGPSGIDAMKVEELTRAYTLATETFVDHSPDVVFELYDRVFEEEDEDGEDPVH